MHVNQTTKSKLYIKVEKKGKNASNTRLKKWKCISCMGQPSNFSKEYKKEKEELNKILWYMIMKK